MRNEKIEDIITNFGPFDQSVNISADRKMTTWKRDKLTYYVNINTDANGLSFSGNNYQSYSSRPSYFNLISPFFLYGNSYRNSAVSLSGTPAALTSSRASQSGSVVSKDEGSVFMIIQDSNNKTIKIYHQNIFSEAQYGYSFNFIGF